MATPTIALNADRVWKKIIRTMLTSVAAGAVASSVGAATVGNKKKKTWVCAGQPTVAPTGIEGGDLVLDTTNGIVYKYISSNTFVSMNATS